ncbi:hypothetical protein [Streptomyces sp. NPDC048638]|uniref:hypothetical protein n=1 Tax=Streptomyces sp. NPDC048638 TaxID=3365580 RepID=UPI00371504A5
MNELTARCSSARSRAVEELAEATAKWGCAVPDDPGITELADQLAYVAGHLPEDLVNRTEAATDLEAAVEHLRAAARLGGLLPLVTLHHLHLARQREHSARHDQALSATADRIPGGPGSSTPPPERAEADAASGDARTPEPQGAASPAANLSE